MSDLYHFEIGHNVTICAENHFDGNVTIHDGSSKVLQHGLSACDEIVQSYVSTHTFLRGNSFCFEILWVPLIYS